MYDIFRNCLNNISKKTTITKINNYNKIILDLVLYEKNPSFTNTEQLLNKFKELNNNINKHNLIFEDKNKIKMYIAKIVSKIFYENKPNPKYNQYVETKKKLLDENKSLSQQRIIELIGPEPEKELVIERIEKKVVLNCTNEKFSSFDNLYLPNCYDEKLKQLYRSFQEDKERFESLGIPNKLCLLLYGEPGTGKTTTIITSGSYFQRDIFYVSLKNISNSGLKMIFDYINENHSNQGII